MSLSSATDTTETPKFLTVDEVRTAASTFSTRVLVHDEAPPHAPCWLRAVPIAFGTTIRRSLKANPNAGVIALFARLGVDFNASSIWEARRAGPGPRRARPGAAHLPRGDPGHQPGRAVEAGLHYGAGSLDQLRAFGGAYPDAAASARINPGFRSGLVNRLTGGGPNSTFGPGYEHLPEVKHLHLKPVVLTVTEPGDYLVGERYRGYAASMSLENFRCYPESPESLRRSDGSFDVIRERQTIHQIATNKRVPVDLAPPAATHPKEEVR